MTTNLWAKAPFVPSPVVKCKWKYFILGVKYNLQVRKSGAKQKSLEVSLMSWCLIPPQHHCLLQHCLNPAEPQLWRHLCSSGAHDPCTARGPPWDLWDAVMELPFTMKNKQQAVGMEAASFSLQPCQAILVPPALRGSSERPRAPRPALAAGEEQEAGQGQGHLLTSHSAKNATCCQALGKAFFLSAAKDPWGFWWEEAYSMIFILFSQVFFKRGDANDMV